MATVRTVTAKRGEMDVDVLVKGGKPLELAWLGHARRITSYTGISLQISTSVGPQWQIRPFRRAFWGNGGTHPHSKCTVRVVLIMYNFMSFCLVLAKDPVFFFFFGGGPFVKRFAICYRTLVCPVCK